ncbi:poly(A)-binding protein binding protein [Ascochyta rabiei]|uniref:poly(A)-binding protein binding protein n=1 Tax=Didymella rabiei TaxID=5454 RepID=UPI002202C913|nr:poly(A)-binding protein binding protein [Ascochyta rabiei]UPX16779.1 poly(A)-binding protein binding protein [Ascochyta rabiei]
MPTPSPSPSPSPMSTAASTLHSASNALSQPAATPGHKLKMASSAKAMDAHRKPGSPVDAAQRKSPAPKPWSHGSANPITHRSSTSTPSNGLASTPKPANAVSAETATPMRHLSDRMMYLLANLTGLPGTITLKNGARYSGVLSGTSLDPSELRYVFKMVKLLQPADHAQPNGQPSDEYAGQGESHVMSFDMTDVADFHVNNVVLDKTQAKPQNGTAAFRTDADISGNLALRERNLQRWEPSEHDTSLELGSGGLAGWDQFATNDRITGVKSNYDETMYTTAIDRSNPQYAQRAARAERLAREIESSTASNAHVREERGGHHAQDDQGLDEEDKYSGVRRHFSPLPSGQPNRYTPPARRAPSAQPTVQGAPIDPAILSSTIARPDSAAAKPAQRTASPIVEKPADAAPAPPAPAPPAPAPPAPVAVPSQPSAPKDAAPQAEAEAKSAAALEPVAEPAQKPSSAAKPAMAAIAAIPPRKSARPHDATTNVEHDLLDSFKAFSAAEKLRVTERQRTIARENKAVKLNDLKKFALNFKLSTPVPTDLVPILAKDETKQAAIVEKALKQAQETKPSPPKTPSTVSDPKAAARAAAAKLDATSTSPSDRQQAQRPRPGQSAYPSASMRERSHQAPAQIPARNQGSLSTRLQMNQQQHKQQGAPPYNGVPQPIPAQDTRAPSGPSQASSGAPTPTSGASSRFNVRAHEFRPNPAANTFQPGGNTSATSSPRPDSASRQESRRTPAITSFFGGHRPTLKAVDAKEAFSPLDRLAKVATDADKKYNAGVPFSHRTPPTWDFPESNRDKGYKELFEHVPPRQMAAPHNGMANGPLPHQHQLPPHLQGPQGMQQGHTPQHTPRGPHVQPHHGQGPPHFEAPHMQFSHSTSSVQPSPRQMPPYAYGAQPQPMPGYPQQMQMPQYGMSPGVQHVALRGPQGGQFVNGPGPQMGGHMMQQQPSNGPFMGMPGQPQMQMYAQAPGYPHYPGHMPPGANGFPSPRPGAPMMSHQGSQQGHQQPPVVYMQPGAQGPQMYQMPPASMTPMRGPYPPQHQPPYGSSPHQQHPFPHQAHRGTPSASYAQPMVHQHSQHQHQAPPTGPAKHGSESTEEPK